MTTWPAFLSYDLLRGLHIIAMVAWMAALMLLPRLFAYHTETAPPGSEFDAHFIRWEGKVVHIIMTPAIGLTWLFGISLILFHVYGAKEGWGFLAQPWMIVKLVCVLFISGWHGMLSGAQRRIAAGERPRTARYWRATNEIPFLVAIVAILAVTLQFFGR